MLLCCGSCAAHPSYPGYKCLMDSEECEGFHNAAPLCAYGCRETGGKLAAAIRIRYRPASPVRMDQLSAPATRCIPVMFASPEPCLLDVVTLIVFYGSNDWLSGPVIGLDGRGGCSLLPVCCDRSRAVSTGSLQSTLYILAIPTSNYSVSFWGLSLPAADHVSICSSP